MAGYSLAASPYVPYQLHTRVVRPCAESGEGLANISLDEIFTDQLVDTKHRDDSFQFHAFQFYSQFWLL